MHPLLLILGGIVLGVAAQMANVLIERKWPYWESVPGYVIVFGVMLLAWIFSLPLWLLTGFYVSFFFVGFLNLEKPPPY